MKHLIPLALLGLLLGSVTLNGCANVHSETSGSRLRTANSGLQLDGIWQSDGYGYVVIINKGQVTGFDATNKTCVSTTEEPFDLDDFYSEYIRSPTGKTVQFFSADDVFGYHYYKLDELPLICQTPTLDTPQSNFDSFVDYFETHYAFFDLYSVDWLTRTAKLRQNISDETTDQELFDIFKTALAPIKDAHVTIQAELDIGTQKFSANPESVKEIIIDMAMRDTISTGEAAGIFYNGYWLGNVKSEILKDDGIMTANNRIQYGMVSEKTGYIAILGESRFAMEEGETDLDALNQAMDSFIALLEANEADHVIIDISVNFGGRGYLSREIASRFAHEETQIYSKMAMDKKVPEKVPYTLSPHSGYRFTGAVTLVTSNVTVSAGEELTLALRALSNVTHVGEATRGALSDKLSKTLPNGWEITLSNEVYEDSDGKIWEGKGITPNKPLPVFPKEHPLEAHRKLISSIMKGR